MRPKEGAVSQTTDTGSSVSGSVRSNRSKKSNGTNHSKKGDKRSSPKEISVDKLEFRLGRTEQTHCVTKILENANRKPLADAGQCVNEFSEHPKKW